MTEAYHIMQFIGLAISAVLVGALVLGLFE